MFIGYSRQSITQQVVTFRSNLFFVLSLLFFPMKVRILLLSKRNFLNFMVEYGLSS